MTATCFVDTNLLVYARDASEPVKQPRAHNWLSRVWATRTGRIGVQVLSEFYVTVTCKLKPGLSPEEAWNDVAGLMTWKPVPTDGPLLIQGRAVQERFDFSWWDALIVAAGHRAGCAYLLTEDLQDGQDLDGLVVLDPFKHTPAEVLPAPD